MTRYHNEMAVECEVCGASYSGASAIRNYTRIIWTAEGTDAEEGFHVCRDTDCAEAMRQRIAEREVTQR